MFLLLIFDFLLADIDLLGYYLSYSRLYRPRDRLLPYYTRLQTLFTSEALINYDYSLIITMSYCL